MFSEKVMYGVSVNEEWLKTVWTMQRYILISGASHVVP
jgi:hypothetical protein